MAENRVKLHLCGKDYTLVSRDAPSYVESLGTYVNDKVKELCEQLNVSLSDALVLAAVNITDELMKERRIEEDLRRQIKATLDDSAQVQNELSKLKRENFELKNRLGNGNRRG